MTFWRSTARIRSSEQKHPDVQLRQAFGMGSGVLGAPWAARAKALCRAQQTPGSSAGTRVEAVRGCAFVQDSAWS
jgi:hypothetical protein